MVRSYLDDPLEADLVDALIRAAHSGPSAGNSRSLELLVLTDQHVDAYWEVTLPEASRASFPWPGLLVAPLLLVPYVDPATYVDRYAEADKARTGLGESTAAWPVPYWWVDGGAAVENVLIAATALELGACFFGQFDNEHAVKERFGVPDGKRALGTIAVGHPNRDDDRPSRSAARPRRSIEETTHYGRWSARS